MNQSNDITDGLLYILDLEKETSNKEDCIELEFVMRGDKILIKNNNLITDVITPNGKDYQKALQIMESLKNDKN